MGTSIQRRDLLTLSAATAGAVGLDTAFPSTARASSPSSGVIQLTDHDTTLRWGHDAQGWRLTEVSTNRGHARRSAASPSGLHSLWYVPEGDAPAADTIRRVSAGRRLSFRPTRAEHSGRSIRLSASTEAGTVISTWWLSGGQVLVQVNLTASRAGWFGLPLAVSGDRRGP